MLNTKEKILLSLPALTAAIFTNVQAEGYASGYSDWSTTKTGNSGEVSRTEYRYADVSSWSACDSSHTTKPSDGHYVQGTYDPKNCTWWSQGSCASWSCTSWYVSGQSCSNQFVWCIWTCHGCGWWDNTWHSGDYWCEQGWQWTCTDNWACNGWTCSSYNQVQHNDGSCGNTGTCYATPTSWSSWSAWSATAVSTSTSRKVETRTVYSYPQNVQITVDPNGGTLTKDDSSITQNSNGTVTFTATYGTQNYYDLGVEATKTGYTATGIYTDKTGGTKIWNADGLAAKDGTYFDSNYFWKWIGGSSKTVYVQYEANTYTITYNTNGGSSIADQSFKYNQGENITTSIPTKTGYTFAGWLIQGTSTILQAGNAIPTGSQNLTLVAQWKTNYTRYTISCVVDKNGTIVKNTDTISKDANYSIVQKTFDVAENDTAEKILCLGKLISQTKVSY